MKGRLLREWGSVRARLLRLALLLVLPGLAISALLTWRIFVIARQDAETALLGTARGLDQLVDREFVQAEVLLRTLAATQALRRVVASSGHDGLAEFDQLARSTAMQGTAIVLADASGQTLVDTCKPAGAAPALLPVAGWAGETVGQPVISALVARRGGGVLSARVILPLGKDGHHGYDLELVMPAASMQALLVRDKLPAGWVSSIMDGNATLVARTLDPERFVGHRAGQGLRDGLAGADEGVRDGTAIDGTKVVVAFSRSAHSRWTVAVASPHTAIAQAGRQSTLLLLALGSGALVLGLLGALRVARGIARPIEAMAQAARGLGESGAWAPIPGGLAEADAVARAMVAATGSLVERREALHALNATLSERVEARTAELAQANAALADQGRRLGDMLDHVPLGVVVHEASGALRFVNLAARRLLGLPPGGPVSFDDFPPAQRGGVALTVAELPSSLALQGHSVEREVLTVQRRDRAALELETYSSPLRGPDGRVVLALTTLQDVTARLEAEEARRRSQRLEAVGQLTGGVAHEFNNLLMAVSGCLELLGPHVLAAFGAASRPAGLLANASRAADRGAGLTGQLLAFARRQTLLVEAVDLNALVDGMTQLLEGTLGRLVEVEFQADPEAWPAMADAAQLELVVLNLAINARDAMPGGGKLILCTSNRRTGPPFRAEDPPEGEHVVLHVRDTGHGMPPQVLARAFEPFFTTKEVGRGSGLGLPQVLGVAQQLGGGVSIASEPGSGTTVSLFLPRARGGVAAARPGGAQDVQAGKLGGARLLLVDDDADVREIARSMLEEMGAAVIEADSAAAALLLLRTATIDLVLADVTMPQMSGIELAAEVDRLLPGVPVVLMTGYGVAAMEVGPNVRATLQKPFRAEALLRALIHEPQAP